MALKAGTLVCLRLRATEATQAVCVCAGRASDSDRVTPRRRTGRGRPAPRSRRGHSCFIACRSGPLRAAVVAVLSCRVRAPTTRGSTPRPRVRAFECTCVYIQGTFGIEAVSSRNFLFCLS